MGYDALGEHRTGLAPLRSDCCPSSYRWNSAHEHFAVCLVPGVLMVRIRLRCVPEVLANAHSKMQQKEKVKTDGEQSQSKSPHISSHQRILSRV